MALPKLCLIHNKEFLEHDATAHDSSGMSRRHNHRDGPWSWGHDNPTTPKQLRQYRPNEPVVSTWELGAELAGRLVRWGHVPLV